MVECGETKKMSKLFRDLPGAVGRQVGFGKADLSAQLITDVSGFQILNIEASFSELPSTTSLLPPRRRCVKQFHLATVV